MAETESQEFQGAFSLLRPSVNALMFNIWSFVGLFIIGAVLNIITNIGNNHLESTSILLVNVLAIAAFIAIAPASIIIQLRSSKNKKIDLLDAIREGLPFVARTFLLQILTFVAVLIGFVLLIVPGVIAFQRLLLAQYYLVDQDLGVIESLKASWADAKEFPGAVWGIVGVFVTCLLLMLTIILTPVIFVFLLAYACAPAIRYYQIRSAVKEKTKA